MGKKEKDICATCCHRVQNYTSVIGTIPWCCEKHWHCKPGSITSDYMPEPPQDGGGEDEECKR